MTEQEKQKAAYAMLYLVRCAALGRKPDRNRIGKMNLGLVWQYAKFHSLTAMTYMALESAEGFPDAVEFGTANEAGVLKKWKEDRDKAVRKNMLLDIARNELFSWMDREKIWHMPLKGVILKDLYPKPGMRQMADNDILFDAGFQKKVHDWFVSHGYEDKYYMQGNHDCYYKEPVYNFEMHISLFGEGSDDTWWNYYKDVKDRLIADAGEEYRFKDEDFYVYVVCHAYKHYGASGTGLRSLVDVFMYNRAKGEGLDRDYISAECEKLGIGEFEETARRLSEKVFSAGFRLSDLAEREREMLGFFLGSGTYGTMENRIRRVLWEMNPDGKQLLAVAKLRYLLGRMFPDRKFMRMWCASYYPWFLKHEGLLWLAVLLRIVSRIPVKRKVVGRELKTVIRQR